MIYLDTNVVVWLAAGNHDLISQTALDIIDSSAELNCSPMVILELEYLLEIKRITQQPKRIIDYLQKGIGLVVCDQDFASVIEAAKQLKWTRDPFDRIITAQAAIGDHVLLTSDKTIRHEYPHAVW